MIINKKIGIYITLILSLLIGYYFGENSSGGARIDFGILYPYIEHLRTDLKEGFNIYANNPAILIHSPFFNLIISILLKFSNNLTLINLGYLLVCSLLPFIFYLILKTKIKDESDYLFYISVVIFLSPYFRSTSIWLLGDNLAIIFFSLSTLFFLKSLNDIENLRNYFLCILFLILCSYVRYYYCIYALYFLFNFYQNLNKKILFFIDFFINFISTSNRVFLLYN